MVAPVSVSFSGSRCRSRPGIVAVGDRDEGRSGAASLKTLVIRADNNVVADFHIVEQRLEVQNIAAEHP